jgi:hypothetical protein
MVSLWVVVVVVVVVKAEQAGVKSLASSLFSHFDHHQERTVAGPFSFLSGDLSGPYFSFTLTPSSPSLPPSFPPPPATMISLVLTIFLVNLAIYLVNTIGATTIDNLVCSLNPVLQLLILSLLSRTSSHPSSSLPRPLSSAYQLMNPFN